MCPECETPLQFVACPACGWQKSFGIGAGALPNKRPGVSAMDKKQSRWDRDGDAYKRLKAEGISPPSIDGCHQMEQTAATKEQIETARVRATTTQDDAKVKFLAGPKGFKQFEDRFGHSATTPA